ncbi:MAG: thioredoxin [Firmicutes bacterium]|nr:thioredoxin [Bacillota bacterium]
MVKIIKNNDLAEVNASKYAVVDFSATWCGPCRMVAPEMEELSEELAGEVDFFNCDVDENMELAVKYQIASIPAIAIIKEGELADISVGFQPKEQMKEFILSQK